MNLSSFPHISILDEVFFNPIWAFGIEIDYFDRNLEAPTIQVINMKDTVFCV